MKLTSADLSALERSPLFAEMPRERLLDALASARVRDVASGARLAPPDIASASVSLVVSGTLGIYTDANSRLPMTTVRTGGCFGEEAMLGESADDLRYVAAEPSRLVVFAVEDLWRAMRSDPHIALNLLKILSERVRIKDDRRRASEITTSADGVTGLHNRHWMEEMFGRELLRCQRTGLAAALLMISIDRFRQITESTGRIAGDRLLAELAKLLQRILRPHDLSARYDDDKFCVLMLGIGANKASRGAERLRERVARKPATVTRSMEIAYTISVGVTEWHAGQSLEILLRVADGALRAAGRAGGNCIEIVP